MRFGNPFSRSAFTASLPFMQRGAVLLVSLVVVVSAVLIVAVRSNVARTAVTKTILRTAGTDLPTDDHGFINLLLLGVGDADHDGADLTDTMILASIDPTDTRSVVLLSLPRDLLIDSSERVVSGRINAVYANEKRRLVYREKMEEDVAADQALRTVGEIMGEKLGLPIHGVVKADFTAFTLVVDALGGVDVDVPDTITDYTYPIAEGQVGLFQVEKGMQHFDGETALRYARSRHSTSDFDRSARQQQLLSALVTKVRGLPHMQQLSFVLDAYKMVQGHVVTTLNGPQLLALGQTISTVSRDRLITAQLNFNVGGDSSDASAGGFVIPAPLEAYSGASVLLPLSLPGQEANWGQIQTFVAFLTQHRDVYLQHPVVQIQYGKNAGSQAWRLRNELLRYGFMVEQLASSGSIVELPDPILTRYTNDAEPTAKFISQLLQTPVTQPDGPWTGSGDIVLLLDKNFKYQAFQTLSGSVLGK